MLTTLVPVQAKAKDQGKGMIRILAFKDIPDVEVDKLLYVDVEVKDSNSGSGEVKEKKYTKELRKSIVLVSGDLMGKPGKRTIQIVRNKDGEIVSQNTIMYIHPSLFPDTPTLKYKLEKNGWEFYQRTFTVPL